MDNLTSHKVKGVVGSITAVGASVVYLPPYSPDLIAFCKIEIKDIYEIKDR
jgi:transposase